MENLKEINASQIELNKNYLVFIDVYERYGGGGEYLLRKGSGQELVEYFKTKFELDDDVEDVKEFLRIVDGYLQGDGDDYIVVYELD